jgi:pimeloyl-ACP methyl ester carboxylesterase
MEGRRPFAKRDHPEPTVLILHGLLGSSMNWRSIASNPRVCYFPRYHDDDDDAAAVIIIINVHINTLTDGVDKQ